MHDCEAVCLCVTRVQLCVSGVVQHVHLCGGDAGCGARGCLLRSGQVLCGRAGGDGLRHTFWLRGRLHHKIHLQGPRNRAALHIYVQLPGLPGGRALCHLFHHGVSGS